MNRTLLKALDPKNEILGKPRKCMRILLCKGLLPYLESPVVSLVLKWFHASFPLYN
jgi:hypothetical protein